MLVHPSTSGARDDTITVLGLALVVDAHTVGFSFASRSTRFLSMACLLSSKAIAYALKEALFWLRGAAVTVSFHMLSSSQAA